MLNALKLTIFAAVVTASTLCAAAPGALTRSEVQANLAAVERNGFNPSATDLLYPQDIERAEASATKSAPPQSTAQQAIDDSYPLASAR